MIKLTPRLQAIADRVPQGMRIVDVGTDHGYLPAWLVREGRCQTAWATDIQPGPLKNAQETLSEEGLEDRIITALGPGLQPIRGEAPQGIVVAGMGGILITEILQADLAMAKSAELLLLQPMSGFEELRGWLVQSGFRIVDECLVKEGHRLYEIICARWGNPQPHDPLKDLMGYCLPEAQDPHFPEFLERQIRRHERIIQEAKSAKNADALVRKCQAVLSQLKEMI